MGLINNFKPKSPFPKPAQLINLSHIENFSSEKISGTLGIEPRAAGWEASLLPLCYTANLRDSLFSPDLNIPPGSAGPEPEPLGYSEYLAHYAYAYMNTL